MGAIQSTINKAIAGVSAGIVASPTGQAKISERAKAIKTKELTANVEKASQMAEQSKVELPTDSLAKRYPIGKNKATREQLAIQGSQEIESIKQSMKANQNLGNSLEALYQHDPSDENFKKLMDFKATNSEKEIPMQNEIKGITERLNYIEPDSIIKRKLARERSSRRKDSKLQQRKEFFEFLDNNPNVRTDQLNPTQKAILIDAINGGNDNVKEK